MLDAVKVVVSFPDSLAMLMKICARGGGRQDCDTCVAPESFDSALLSSSTWVEEVHVAMEGLSAAWPLGNSPVNHETT